MSEQSPKQDSASYTQDPSYLGISALKTTQTRNIEATSFTSINAKTENVAIVTLVKLHEICIPGLRNISTITNPKRVTASY